MIGPEGDPPATVRKIHRLRVSIAKYCSRRFYLSQYHLFDSCCTGIPLHDINKTLERILRFFHRDLPRLGWLARSAERSRRNALGTIPATGALAYIGLVSSQSLPKKREEN